MADKKDGVHNFLFPVFFSPSLPLRTLPSSEKEQEVGFALQGEAANQQELKCRNES